jgi:hypothetical protein
MNDAGADIDEISGEPGVVLRVDTGWPARASWMSASTGGSCAHQGSTAALPSSDGFPSVLPSP